MKPEREVRWQLRKNDAREGETRKGVRTKRLTTSLAFFLSLWKRAKSTSRRSAMEVALWVRSSGSRKSAFSSRRKEARELENAPLGSSSIRRNDDTVLDVDVVPDVVDHRRLGVELEKRKKPKRVSPRVGVLSSSRGVDEIWKKSGRVELTLKEEKGREVSLSRESFAVGRGWTHLSTGTSKNPWIWEA